MADRNNHPQMQGNHPSNANLFAQNGYDQYQQGPYFMSAPRGPAIQPNMRRDSDPSSGFSSPNSGAFIHNSRYMHGDATGNDYNVKAEPSASSSAGQMASPTSARSQVADPAPPWAEMKTKAGKDRKRLPLACIACRRKKIRCSGEKPACKHCMKSRVPCVYKVTTRKAAPRTDYMAMLDKRLKRMEERVVKIIPKGEAEKAGAIPRAVVKPNLAAAAQSKSAARKRPAEEAFGADADIWGETHASRLQKSDSKKVPVARQDDQEENSLLLEGAEHLPSKEIQEHLAEVYFDYVYGQAYHLLHKPSFMRRLGTGTIPPVLMLAVCAISARFSNHPQLRTEPAFLRGDNWAKAAREISLRRFDSPNIVILIVYMLLGLHEFGTCQGGRSWMFGGMAHRMAYALQLHKDVDYDTQGQKKDKQSELSFTDREIRRRTMWGVFLMDRFTSSGTERPMFASEAYLELQLPIKEELFQMEIPGPTENLDGQVSKGMVDEPGVSSDARDNMGVAAYIVRLVALWGRAIQYLNLGGRERDKYPIWDDQSGYQVLVDQLKTYKETLPSKLHYNAENLQNHAAEGIANQFIYLHIALNHVTLFLNRFAFPATAISRLPKDMPNDFLQAARKVALEAASSTSNLVDEAMNHRVVVPFAGYCTYMSSAVHIHGIFSKNPQLEETSKENLANNVRYLTKMKKHWGMFHFLTASLKDLYRQHADASAKGTSTPESRSGSKRVFQYGDWFRKYPKGVSQMDYEEPLSDSKKDPGNDAALGQKPELQSVEDFFATLTPAEVPQPRSRPNRRNRGANASQRGAQQAQAQTDLLPTNSMAQAQPNLQPFDYQMDMSASPFSFPESHDRSRLQPPPQTASMLQDQANASNLAASIRQGLPPQGAQQDPLAAYDMTSQNPALMPQLDRQLVLASYNSVDPSQATQGMTNNLWDMDLSAFGDDLFGTDNAEQSSAWFIPFNLNMPDFSADPTFLGLDGGAAGQELWWGGMADGGGGTGGAGGDVDGLGAGSGLGGGFS